jgi:hypothetical protein
MVVIPKVLGYGMVVRSMCLGLDLCTWVKKFKIFQKHDWTAKISFASFKQDFSFIYNRT